MGLRCLLGHDFGEPELRREREEDGNEVVTTVTEVKTCARCGETQVVSENTEVTTLERLTNEATAAGSAAEPDPASPANEPADLGEAGGEPNSGGAAAAAGKGDAEGSDDAVIIDDGPDGAAAHDVDRAEAAGPEGAVGTGAAGGEADAGGDGAELIDDGPAEAGDADGGGGLDGDDEYAAYPEAEAAPGETPVDEERTETDDGVILDEEAEAADDRERGAWPEVDEPPEEENEPTPWPDHPGEDEGFSAEVGAGNADGVEFGGGLTPEAADAPAESEDAEYVEAPTQPAGEVSAGSGDGLDDGVGITRGDSPDLETSTAEVTTEYYCPECEMTRAADGNSMRAGDICPECKRGYVDERPI